MHTPPEVSRDCAKHNTAAAAKKKKTKEKKIPVEILQPVKKSGERVKPGGMSHDVEWPRQFLFHWCVIPLASVSQT